jgi:peptidoglycan hydrolase CwlO-like protein
MVSLQVVLALVGVSIVFGYLLSIVVARGFSSHITLSHKEYQDIIKNINDIKKQNKFLKSEVEKLVESDQRTVDDVRELREDYNSLTLRYKRK